MVVASSIHKMDWVVVGDSEAVPRGGEEQGLVEEMDGGGTEENQKTLMLLTKGTV